MRGRGVEKLELGAVLPEMFVEVFHQDCDVLDREIVRADGRSLENHLVVIGTGHAGKTHRGREEGHEQQ